MCELQVKFITETLTAYRSKGKNLKVRWNRLYNLLIALGQPLFGLEIKNLINTIRLQSSLPIH